MRNGRCRIKRSKIRHHIYEDIKLYNLTSFCLLLLFLRFFLFSFNFFTLDMIACHGYITFSSFLFNNYVLFVRVFCPSHSYSPYSPLLFSTLLYSNLLYSPLLCSQLLCFTLLYSTLKPLHLSVTHSPHRHVSAEDRYICQTHNTANKFRLHFA